MNPIQHLRRFAGVVAGLAAALVAFGATPAFASLPSPGPGGPGVTPGLPVSLPCSPECSPLLDKRLLLAHGHWTGTAHHAHTVVMGGVPGWQIVLIAVAAALFAATVAVLVDRARAARTPVTAAA